jgi:hypothetical protein
MIPDPDFSVMHFQLAPNDKLVLISDGILEATDPHGQLFGFDRVQQHLHNNLSPSALADAVQRSVRKTTSASSPSPAPTNLIPPSQTSNPAAHPHPACLFSFTCRKRASRAGFIPLSIEIQCGGAELAPCRSSPAEFAPVIVAVQGAHLVQKYWSDQYVKSRATLTIQLVQKIG